MSVIHDVVIWLEVDDKTPPSIQTNGNRTIFKALDVGSTSWRLPQAYSRVTAYSSSEDIRG
jgi:hypothetical protein